VFYGTLSLVYHLGMLTALAIKTLKNKQKVTSLSRVDVGTLRTPSIDPSLGHANLFHSKEHMSLGHDDVPESTRHLNVTNMC